MLIDFTEIPRSNDRGQDQDIFEKFCCEFLESVGYTVVSEPGRGADAGIDLKVEEIRKGENGETKFYWLVSCKHYAHSGKSITKGTELDIRDRIEAEGCQGFMGFYSVTPGQSLLTHLKKISSSFEFKIFSNEKIERQLVGVHKQEALFMRFFPNSYKKWKELYYYLEPIKLFEGYIAQRNEYKDSLIISLFSPISEVIKILRYCTNLTDALEQEQISLFVIPAFSSSTFDISFSSMRSVVKEAAISVGMEADKAERYKSLTINQYGAIDYVLYSNELLVSEEYIKILNYDFEALKNIIT